MVVALNAYYDFEHGKTPPRITSEEQLAAMLDEVWRTRKAALVELLPAEDPAAATLDVGFDGDRGVGVLWYSGPDHASCHSYNPDHNPDASGSTSEPVLYYYMTSDTEYPVSAEIPADSVIAAALEYMRTGGRRPANIAWQEAD
ncbi:hypothetical protein GCM10022247_38260 [Allokutzneria multivorans]|uniref:Immunity protein Imm1 n=1 Tax=Allokutzneria multivorans TaxID=1142134 RepID=A0ABP7SIC9_9PSEU